MSDKHTQPKRSFALPTIYHKGKTGAIYQKTIWTEGADIVTEYGQMGGAMMYARRTAEAKNVGRANETTPELQAIREAQADWDYDMKRKYSETPEKAQKPLMLPMLAKTFKDPKKPRSNWGKGIIYPCDVQPKLDGVRCMAYWVGDKIYLGTRNGLEWTAPKHIAKELERYMPKKMILDGELYLHGELFEDLSSWTKKIYPDTARLEYHLFDMPLDACGENHPWRIRKKNLELFFKQYVHQIKMLRLVPVVPNIRTMEEVFELEEKFVADGYEGCMTRNLDDEYIFGGKHEKVIQKVKSSVDDEFKVIGFEDGIGREKGCIKWKCVTKEGLEFDVRPKGSLDKRAELFKDATEHPKKYIGQWLKVRYQNLTEEGKPRFCRGLGFRDKRDM